MKATVKEVRLNLRALLDAVSQGEEVIITYRGEPKARLVPYKEENPIEDELFGIWADNSQCKDVVAYTRTIRKGRFDAD